MRKKKTTRKQLFLQNIEKLIKSQTDCVIQKSNRYFANSWPVFFVCSVCALQSNTVISSMLILFFKQNPKIVWKQCETWMEGVNKSEFYWNIWIRSIEGGNIACGFTIIACAEKSNEMNKNLKLNRKVLRTITWTEPEAYSIFKCSPIKWLLIHIATLAKV